MSHYFFVKDFEEGRVAEKFVMDLLSEQYSDRGFAAHISELPRERQSEGDFEVVIDKPVDDTFTVEVKFDKMAAKTGNLCFEFANGKGKPTGIAATQADTVVYIVPQSDSSVNLYWFNSDELRDYLRDSDNSSKIRVVQGGDRRAYTLLLLSTDSVESDKLAFRIETVDAKLCI